MSTEGGSKCLHSQQLLNQIQMLCSEMEACIYIFSHRFLYQYLQELKYKVKIKRFKENYTLQCVKQACFKTLSMGR